MLNGLEHDRKAVSAEDFGMTKPVRVQNDADGAAGVGYLADCVVAQIQRVLGLVADAVVRGDDGRTGKAPGDPENVVAGSIVAMRDVDEHPVAKDLGDDLLSKGVRPTQQSGRDSDETQARAAARKSYSG